MLMPIAIVRSADAGVFLAWNVEIDRASASVVCERARRIWEWSGAQECIEIAMHGVNPETSKISAASGMMLILGCCEVIACLPEAAARIDSAKEFRA